MAALLARYVLALVLFFVGLYHLIAAFVDKSIGKFIVTLLFFRLLLFFVIPDSEDGD